MALKNAGGRPIKKARPTSVQDVVGKSGAVGAKSGRNTLTVEEVRTARRRRSALCAGAAPAELVVFLHCPAALCVSCIAARRGVGSTDRAQLSSSSSSSSNSGAGRPLLTPQPSTRLQQNQIEKDRVTRLAAKHWAPKAAAAAAAAAPDTAASAFSAEIVDQLYTQELGGGKHRAPPVKRIMLLEVSQYLENYLWPHFDAEAASVAHVMSIVVMVNQKFKEGVPAWSCFHTREVRRALGVGRGPVFPGRGRRSRGVGFVFRRAAT